ncbi:hypothetical protein [Vibrio phage vB_VmeM-Yong XC32]|nr:hypothetical protein [Vibrio phage vB_VmeM-Yong XC31]QAX96605.1 hypothetical protein [Vibrio phage vB_VmeM-Yong XC32]QAX96923.1 hypothetical protein [Vibrio phage vB_VmeM-Yong MS31]QAX97228.1 hypothetical protein [Vibrio phage vB_VmeM-Yong MS32]
MNVTDYNSSHVGKTLVDNQQAANFRIRSVKHEGNSVLVGVALGKKTLTRVITEENALYFNVV